MGKDLDRNPYLDSSGISIPAAPLTKPFTIVRGVLKALRWLRKIKPRVVVGFGSYHTFPVLVAATILRIPIVLYEPNAVFGRVNKLFAPLAKKILTQFPITKEAIPIARCYPKDQYEEAKAHYGFTEDKPVVLVLGGSQGARAFDALSFPPTVQVLHLAGTRGPCEDLAAKYKAEGVYAHVLPFEREMARAWLAADYAVCRSGAMTLGEHLHYRVPTLFIPYPSARDDHQWVNAVYAQQRFGGSLVMREKDISLFPTVFAMLLTLSPKDISPPTYETTLQREIDGFHFIGIGGIGMSSLAHILLDRNIPVSGTDVKQNTQTVALANRGAEVGYNETTVPPLCTVVYSSAISPKDPLRKQAKNQRIPTMHRAQLLGNILTPQKPLLVTGTHGKTSVTGMLIHAMCGLEEDPTFSIGGVLRNIQTNGRSGKGLYSIAEADESDGTFCEIPCHSAIITNIEPEHMDYYRTETRLRRAFQTFMEQIQAVLVTCADDPFLQSMKPKGVTYGFSEHADVQIQHVEVKEGRSILTLSTSPTPITLPVVGQHAVLNATAVMALLQQLGFSLHDMSGIFADYQGVARRLEQLGTKYGITFYDDYAHHPTEVDATLRALKQKEQGRRIVTVFQPHKYSRFAANQDRFAEMLSLSDEVFITDIYAAGEAPLAGVDPKTLLRLLQKGTYAPRETIAQEVYVALQEGDVVITMGAGDITTLGKELLGLLEKR